MAEEILNELKKQAVELAQGIDIETNKIADLINAISVAEGVIAEIADALNIGREAIQNVDREIKSIIGQIESMKQQLIEGMKSLIDIDKLRAEVVDALNSLKESVVEKVSELFNVEELSDDITSKLESLKSVFTVAQTVFCEAVKAVNAVNNLIDGTTNDIKSFEQEKNTLLKALKALELVLSLLERVVEMLIVLISVLIAILTALQCVPFFGQGLAAPIIAKLNIIKANLVAFRTKVQSLKSYVSYMIKTIVLVKDNLRNAVNLLVEEFKEKALAVVSEQLADLKITETAQEIAHFVGVAKTTVEAIVMTKQQLEDAVKSELAKAAELLNVESKLKDLQMLKDVKLASVEFLDTLHDEKASAQDVLEAAVKCKSELLVQAEKKVACLKAELEQAKVRKEALQTKLCKVEGMINKRQQEVDRKNHEQLQRQQENISVSQTNYSASFN